LTQREEEEQEHEARAEADVEVEAPAVKAVGKEGGGGEEEGREWKLNVLKALSFTSVNENETLMYSDTLLPDLFASYQTYFVTSKRVHTILMLCLLPYFHTNIRANFLTLHLST